MRARRLLTVRSRRGALTALTAIFLAAAICPARATEPEAPLDGRSEASMQEIARQLTHPIPRLWTLSLQNSLIGMGGSGFDGVEPAYSGTIQPSLPLDLSRLGLQDRAWARRYSLRTQLTIPILETLPESRSGFGDIQLVSGLAPAKMDGFMWALGGTFIFPSASSTSLGQGKWQAGPAAMAGYTDRDWSAFAFAQQWWSFAGNESRSHTNQLSLNYVLMRTLPGRWQVGMQPTLSVDWTASPGDRLTLPVGLGAGRTIRIGGVPVQFWLEADYYAVRPDDFPSPRWGIDFQITPVLPEPW